MAADLHICVQAEGHTPRKLVIAEGLLGTLQDRLACSLSSCSACQDPAWRGAADFHKCVQAEGQPPRKLVIAEGLLGTLQDKLPCSFSQLLSLPGSSLEGCKYRHPLAGMGDPLDRESPVVVGGDSITTDAGTGLVHTAPGHGVEDYQASSLHAAVQSCCRVIQACAGARAAVGGGSINTDPGTGTVHAAPGRSVED